MGKILVGCGLFLMVLAAGLALVNPSIEAQRRPRGRISPHETATSTVGNARLTITYGRPSMRGRKIFGGLVRYERIWMPGADEATIFGTTAPLRFGTVLLPAGEYSLYTLPGETSWKLIINKMTGQFHTYYDQGRDFSRLDMAIERLAQDVEQLTISALPISGSRGRLQLEWERTRVSVPFTVGE